MSSEERAKLRGAWPIRRFELGAEPGDDLSTSTTPEERLAMMWRLALDSWASSGQPLPAYTRESMPGVVVRPPKRMT